ncbi:MAG TPA: hypothetical protein VIC08_13205 [Cellvibrionaceae bacterium]
MGIVSQLNRCLIAAALVSAGGVTAAPDKHQQVADLRYGESLYHYYQGDYPGALGTLMVAESNGGIRGHKHYPALMTAGMQLSFGMRHSAERGFNQLLGQGEPAIVRDTARYQLARLHYLEGDYSAATANLDKLGVSLAPHYQDHSALLRVHLAIKTGPVPSITESASLLPLSQSRALALFNLGNGASRAGDNARAQGYYRAALAVPVIEGQSLETYFALRDKTHTALGYSLLGKRDYAAAKEAFRAVRRDTALANPALLGYGWAAASYGDFKLALTPWQALSKRSLTDTSVLQAQVAVPWAYEQLQAPGAALAAYRDTEALLTHEYQQATELAEQLNAQQVIAAVSGQSTDWLSPDTDSHNNWLTLNRSQRLFSGSDYLQQLLTRSDFQADVQALDDLLALSAGLDTWLHKLSLYRQMLQDKEALRGDNPEQQALLASFRQQQTDVARERERLDEIARRHRAVVLADDNTRALWQRVERSNNTLKALAASGRDTQDQAGKLRLLAGIIQWQAAQEFPDNLWRAEKNLRQAEAMVADNAAISARISRLLVEGNDIAAQLARIDSLSQQSREQRLALIQGINSQAQLIAQRLDSAIDQHRGQVQNYLAQVRLNMATLYEAAYTDEADR